LVGFVPLARTTFDTALATRLANDARQTLTAAGLAVAGPTGLVTSLEEVARAGRELAELRPDFLIVFQATFADTTLLQRLVDSVQAPLLLWDVPEERSGGRLALNSFCGLNLATHALTERGRRYDYLYAPPDDPTAQQTVSTLARAGRALRLLRGARLGLAGTHPDGLDTCDYDAASLAIKLGVTIVPVQLEAVLDAARLAPATEVQALFDQLATRLDGLDGVDRVATFKTLGVYLALRRLARELNLSAWAVRCWPEFFTQLGCAACGAMSLLSDEGLPCACEADVHGAISQLLLQLLSGEPAFGTDVVPFHAAADTAVVWHCGLAPLSMADPAVRPRATIHSNRRLPLLFEFPLQPGPLTLARLSHSPAGLRLVVGRGEMLHAPLPFAGTSGTLRFSRPAGEVMRTLLDQGLEHHLALTYGDHEASLLALARWLDLPVVPL